MTEKLPIHFYQLSSGDWTLVEYQSGEVIPVSVGGTGASSTDGIKETIGLFSSSTSGLVSSVPLATSAYTLLGNGWRLTSSIIGIESVSTLRDTTFAGSPSLNQVLTWNGTKWTAATPPGATGGEANTGSNIGGGPGSSFDYKLGVDLRFRTLSGVNIGVSTVGDLIQLSGVRPTTVSSVDSAITTTVNATTDYDYYLVNTTTTSVTVYLPAASANPSKIITVSKVDDGGSYRSVTVSGTELVTATNTVLLYDPTESVTVISNGTNWYSLDYDKSYGVVFVCKNNTGSTLTKGTPVKVTGATGANVLIGPVSAANNHIPSDPSGQLGRCIGVVEHDIPNGEFGHVLTKGSLYKYNTNSFNEGDVLYLAASGGFTNVKPTPPYEEVFLGIVTRKESINGSILIDVANPIHINDIVGFNLSSSLTNNDLICYDSTTSTFKNIQPSTILTGAAGEVNTGSNIGSGPGSSFSGKVGVDLQFRTLSGINLNISTVGNVVLVSGSGGVTDHGSLTGLADNDHPQYVLSSTNSTLSSTVSNHIASSTVHFTQAEIDHGAILGLADNDHPQYVLSSTNSALSSLVNNHVTSSTVHFTQAEIDHGAILGLADNDHPQYVLSATNNNLSSLVNNHIASAVHWDLATLNSNYINASGDSANAAFFFQTLSATTVSATNYLNIRPNVSSVNSAATTSFTAGGDYDTYLINTTTTSVIAYLPEASSYTNKMITFSKVDDGGSYKSVTVSGAQLITATNTVILYDPTESVTVISNGTNWYSLDYDRSYGVVIVCKNSTGSTLAKGTPVKVTGATGANVLIGPVSASNTHVPQAPNGSLSRCIGVVEHDIPNGAFGHVLTKGVIYKFNTNAYNEGDILYLASSGGFTNVKPTPPYDEVFLGIVTRKQSVNGSILIDIANPIHINDIVGFNLASSISERDVIAYDLTTSTFKNYNPSSFNVSSATSATLALSATSALNAQGAPNGFIVTGTLTATTASATTYLNLPSSIATWNASALQGKTLNAAAPTINEILRYNGTQWINDSETQYSLNGELGAGWTINAASGINFTNTATNTFRITANYTSGIWNASALQGSPLSATLVPTTNQGLIYNGSVWTASTLPAVITDHGTLTGLSDNDHPQYVLSSTNNALSSLVNNHIASASVHFVMSSIDHTLIQNIGTNSHADIDNHISDQNNPHIVTAEQVGNTTAQWNASSLFGYEVKDINPNNEEILQWNNSTLLWVPTPIFNTTAKWNASAIAGSPLSATLGPTTGQSLVYNGTVWTASTVVATGGGGGGGIADASSLRGSPLSATLVPTAGQALMYNGSVWTASAALFAYTYGSGAPTGGSDGDIYLQTDVEALQVATVSATTVSAINLIAASGEVSSTRLTDYSERKSSPTISSSSLTLDLNAAQVFTVSLNSNISTLTISNTESRANSVQGFTLILTADGTARTITWPGSVKWPSGTGPTLTSTNAKVDILSFVSPDNGTTWYGFIGGQNY